MQNVALIAKRMKPKSTAEHISQQLQVNEIVGAHLKKWREQSGISLEEVEAKLNVPVDLYAAWELGAISPQARKFYAVVHMMKSNVRDEASELINRLMNEAADLRAGIAIRTENRSHPHNCAALGFVHKFAA